MAKTFSGKGKIKNFPAPNAEDSGTDGAPPVSDPPETAPAAEKPKRGRPKAEVPPKSISFWDRIAKIDKDDWGTRAKIKVYRLYPIINRLATQELKFVAIYGTPGEPALTEDQLKVDHGSGKYRLYFNYKAAGEHDDKEMDRVEVSILDQNYPPKIPPGEWMDDPRNKNWSWAKPKDPNQQMAAGQPPLEQVTDLLRLGSELRKEAREEIREAMPPPAPPAQTPVTNGIHEVFAAAAEVLRMRSDNPMVEGLQKQIEAMRTEIATERAESRKLERELAEQRLKALEDKLTAALNGNPKPATEEKSWIDKLEEAAEQKDRLAKLLGQDKETGSRRVTWTDRLFDFGSKIIESPAASALGTAIANRMMQGPPPAAGLAGQPRPVAVQPVNGNPATDFQAFIQTVTPPMVGYLKTESTGDMFASWVYAGWPGRFKEMQVAKHPAMPGQEGTPVIVAFYKNSQYWAEIIAAAETEQRFQTFIGEFCKWNPEDEQKENIPEADTEDMPAPDAGEGDEDREELQV